MTESIEFCGEKFHVAEKVGLMALMRFAKAARAGITTADMHGLAVMHDLIEQCIHPDDWERFQDHAASEQAGGDELMRAVRASLSVIADRPTGRSSDSSGGPQTIEPRSTDDSSLRVVSRFNQAGRPDLALLARKASRSA